jgi:hypothetical protein
VTTPKFPILRRLLITPQCYIISTPQDTSSVYGGGSSDRLRRTVEAGVKAVGDVCVKVADGCGTSPDRERGVKRDCSSINAECVCSTGDECGIEVQGEDNEHVTADGGCDDSNNEGDSCVVLEFNLGSETVGTGDSKIAACVC